MIEHVGDMVAEMLRGDVDHVQPCARSCRRDRRVIALVIAGKLGEAAMKVLVHAALGLAGQDRDQARIDAARNIGADRHVAAQVNSRPCRRAVRSGGARNSGRCGRNRSR